MKPKKEVPEVITLVGKTRAQQKCIIAHDIINNINAQVYTANRGSYVNMISVTENNKWQDVRYGELANAGVKENFSKIRSCTVCALGACLMSITKFNNRLTFNELPLGIGWQGKQLKLLTDIFTPNELAKIEVAFEGKWSYDESNIGRDKLSAKLSDKTVNKIMKFHELYNDSEKRLVAIMESIIANKGKLVLQKSNKKGR